MHVHNLGAHIHGSTCKHRDVFTHSLSHTLVSSSWYLHACLCLNAHIPSTHWAQHADPEAQRAGLGKLPSSLHLSCFSGVSWQLLTANYSTGADQSFNKIWQLSAEDKIKRQTHIMLTARSSGTNANKPLWIITVEYLVSDHHQWSEVKRRSQEDIMLEYRGREKV